MIVSKLIRERIVLFAENNAFKEEAEALVKEEDEIAEKLRISWNGGEEATKEIDKAPAHYYQVHTTPPSYKWDGYPRHKNYERYTHNQSPDYNPHSVKTEWEDIKFRKETLKAKRKKLGEDLNRSLLSLRTVKKVREMYPEFAAMLPAEGNPPGMVPVLYSEMQVIRANLINAGVIKEEKKEEENVESVQEKE
jgi:hypothetical protein